MGADKILQGEGNVFIQSIENGLQRIGLEWLCMIFMLLFGTMLCFITPPYQVPDEPAHFARAWQISEGVFFSPVYYLQDVLAKPSPLSRFHIKLTGGADAFPKRVLGADIPSSMLPIDMVDIPENVRFATFDRYVEYLVEPIEPSQRESFIIPNTGAYAPLLYAPQALAALVGRSLGFSSGATFYFMRWSALLFVAICVFISMRLLPEKKFLLFILAVMPMFLIEAASVSADPVVYGICFIASTYLFSLRKHSGKFHGRELFCLICLALILGVSKQVYGVILAIYFIIPWQKMGSRVKFYGFGAGLLFLCCLSSFIWIYLAVYSNGIESLTWPKVDEAVQKEFILQQPGTYLEILLQSMTLNLLLLPREFVGVFGWGKLPVSNQVFFPYLITLLMGGAVGKLGLNAWNRVILIAAFAFFTIAMFTIEYIIWTLPGSSTIEGMQGRYFIPVALLFFCSLSCTPALKLEHTMAAAIGLLGTFSVIRITLAAFYGI